MKKLLMPLISAVLCISVISFAGTQVWADVLPVPIGDVFFDSFEDECDYIEVRSYTITDDCIVYNDPRSKDPICQLNKGAVILSDYSYTDGGGTVWQNIMPDGDASENGWFKSEFAEVIYDRFSFEDDHREEFSEYAGELDDYVPKDTVYIWQYPGSGKIIDKYPAESWFTDPDYFLTVHDAALYSYTDTDGDKWIYMSYGIWGWVYLPDPESSVAVILAKTAAENTSASDAANFKEESAMNEENKVLRENETDFPNTGYKIPIAMSIITGVISGILIFIIRKKRKEI
ncbi:MAG: hypothetical protein NC120_00285 [Ruminococcus sp.]|nr:hypothetical protein [Ruminococcus sp.]